MDKRKPRSRRLRPADDAELLIGQGSGGAWWEQILERTELGSLAVVRASSLTAAQRERLDLGLDLMSRGRWM